jgi:DNA-binding FadR family transcriptional regulator
MRDHPQISPIKKMTLSEEVMTRLSEMIIQGDLPKGTKLPTERELSERFGVARGPIREALRGLAMIGMVEIRPSEGSFVAQESTFSPDQVLWVFHEERNKVRDIYEARRVIETEMIVQAAKKATPEQKENLRRLHVTMSQPEVQADIEEFIRLHSEFHEKIGEAAGNRVFVQLMNFLHVLQEEAHREVLRLPGAIKNSLRQDGEVLDAICQGSTRQARQAAKAHYTSALKLLDLKEAE